MARKKKSLEEIKRESHYLRGPLDTELGESTSHFSEPGKQVLKFHGIYQQDDRDSRRERKRSGLEPAYQFMVRTKLPGGFLKADQYLMLDDLADTYANGALRITTRQGFQLHGVLKGDLQRTLQTLNERLITTLAACGDVQRNVTCCPAPTGDPVRTELQRVAQALSDHLAPRSSAYHQIWLNGEKLSFGNGSNGKGEGEAIYGQSYLPRKFKTAVAYPGDNCVDIFSNDLGFVAVLDETGQIEGYTILVGGGLGATHKKPETFPRLADPLAFIAPEEVIEVAEAVVRAYRDHGNRENRKQARLKYLIHQRGLAWFKEQVEGHLGRQLAPPRPLPPFESHDHLGWNRQADGRLWLGLPVENGRVVDQEGRWTRGALRAIVERFRPDIYLTPQHNILLTGIAPEDKAAIEALLLEHAVLTLGTISNVRRHEMACPALPTCGLAIAESERVAPALVDDLEQVLARLGIPEADINLRMTGCPNGCARPYVSEISFVGRSVDKYTIYVGGDFNGTRLGEPLADLVPREALIDQITPLLVYWRDERFEGERFGDFCDRIGIEGLQAYADHYRETVAVGEAI